MKQWILRQAELGNFDKRSTIYIFSLKMSFVAVLLSLVVMLVLFPGMDMLGLLPLSIFDAIRLGVLMSWLIGGVVSGVLALLAGYVMHDLVVTRAEFERLSRTDMLSGLLNRRGFTEALALVDDEASLVIFDADRFKVVNDRYGHAAGDAVIAKVSKMLSLAFGTDDVVARLGGEEFGVIVRGATLEERITRIEDAKILVAASPIAIDGGEITISISAGVADIRPDRKMEAAYAAADKALYLAKALGRNRVVHESEELLSGLHRGPAGANTDDADAPAAAGQRFQGYGI